MKKQKAKNYKSIVNVVDNNNLHKRLVHYIFVSFCGLAFIYTLMLVSMVWNIVERKSLDARARSLSSEVADMELEYLKLADSVDVGMSLSMGFHEVKPTFAKPTKALGSLAKLDNEI